MDIAKIYNHLGEYKLNVLNIKEDGFHKGKQYCHILPKELGEANYLCDEALDESRKIKRHLFWCHLNSSQTMCINFFAPLFNNNYEKLNKLLEAILNREIKIVFAEFEHNEQAYSSEFDFYCLDDKGHKYYFEIKYTEEDIAKHHNASSDPYEVFQKFYAPLIRENGNLKHLLDGDNWKIFMEQHYQAYRNFVMASKEKENYCFLITLKGNSGTLKELTSAIEDSKNEIENVVPLFWEELLPKTHKIFDCDIKLKSYYIKFAQKYLI